MRRAGLDPDDDSIDMSKPVIEHVVDDERGDAGWRLDKVAPAVVTIGLIG